MAINFNDLNNSGIIGLQPLEGMALPVNQNMDQAFLFKSAEEKALDQIEDLRKDQNTLTSPVGGDINLLKDVNEFNYNKYQDLENKIQDLKQQFPGDADIQQAFLTNQYGFPLTASLSGNMPIETLDLINKDKGIVGIDQIKQKPKKIFSILDFLPFGDKSISGAVLRGIGSILPERDPRQTALNEFYATRGGLDSIGRVAPGGLMAGYNPVSGGFLNMITGGRFGDPTRYGLQRAYQKRIDTIKKTLAKKQSDVLTARLAELKAEKARELQALQTAQRAKDRADIDRAYREETGDSYSGGESTPGDDTSYSDPFDPGGGE